MQLKTSITPPQLAFIGYCMIAIGMSVTHPVMSIGQGLVMIAGLWFAIQNKHFQKPTMYSLIMGMLFILPLFSGLYTDNLDRWLTLMRIKFPLLLFPIFAAQLPALTSTQFRIFSGIYVAVQAIVAILSFGVYFVNNENGWEAIQQHVDKNGTIDILTHVHHIYFGLFLAFAVILGAVQTMRSTDKKERMFFAIFTIIDFMLIHLLTSRTGFFTLYLGIGVMIVHFIIEKRKYFLGTALLTILVSLPIAAYYLVPTVHSRIALIQWELNEFYNAKNLTDGSMSKRILAWDVMGDVIRENPFLGIGAGDVGAVIKEGSKAKMKEFQTIRYDMDESRLLESPHNQYLENIAACGFLGLIPLLLVLFIPLYKQSRNVLVLTFVFMVGATMMTESFLERQWGVAFVLTFFALLGCFYPNNKITQFSFS